MRDLKTVAEERNKLLTDQKSDYDAVQTAPSEQQQGIVERINARATDLNKISDEYTQVFTFEQQRRNVERDIAEMRETTVNGVNFGGAGQASGKQSKATQEEYDDRTLTDRFAATEEYKNWVKHPTSAPWQTELKGICVTDLPRPEVKTTMTTSAGFAPYPPRLPRIVLTPLRRPVVADLIPNTSTSDPTIIWMEETTFTNNAAMVAQGATKPEAALAYTQRSTPVEKLAVTLPVTDEQLADVPQIRNLIDNRLTTMIQLVEETQLLTGNGTTPQLLGFLNKPSILSTAKGAGEDNPDAILRAITNVDSVTGFANTSGIVMHPLNWLNIRLLRTTEGLYIWGHPSVEGPARLWGLPVVPTPAITQDTALLGDFALYSELFRRQTLVLDVGWINDDFTKNLRRIRLEERLALVIYRANAFSLVTSLASSSVS
jgi:HK97 family phage major capsid protein